MTQTSAVRKRKARDEYGNQSIGSLSQRRDICQNGGRHHAHVFEKIALAIGIQQRQPTHHERADEPPHDRAARYRPQTQEKMRAGRPRPGIIETQKPQDEQQQRGGKRAGQR